jgi:hypothetical protein
MEKEVLQRHFAKIGAKIDVHVDPRQRGEFAFDVRRAKQGEVFALDIRPDVYANDGVEFQVLNVRPRMKHLLLMARGPAVLSDTGKQKYLFGHDERHWFVAAVPEDRPVKDVRDALDALKPEGVLDSQRVRGVEPKNWHQRRNVGYLRQGEWFFLPCPGFEPEAGSAIHQNEPIQRSGGTPHIVEKLHRRVSETVYVCRQYPDGLGYQKYRDLIARDPQAKRFRWGTMQRVRDVYAMGKVRHPDHKTIVLPFWHQVLMSEEPDARGANVVFLD